MEHGDDGQRRVRGEYRRQAQAEYAMNMGHYFLLALLVAVLGACFYVVADYGHAIILGIIFAFVFAPVHGYILRLAGGRRYVASLLSALVLTLTVILPLVFVGGALVSQGIDSFNAIHLWIASGEYQKVFALPMVVEVREFVSPYLPDIKSVFPKFAGRSLPLDKTVLDTTSLVGKFLVSQGGWIVSNFTAFVGQFLLMLLVFFFMLLDGDTIVKEMKHLLPLSASHEEKILDKIHDVSRSVLLGTFLTALAQGVAGGLAFWFVGLPGLFWGSMMTVAALIPFVGTALIWLPACGYLLLQGRWGAALFLACWFVAVVGSLDNLIRPLMMKGAAKMSPLLVFLALIGGINSFGLIGLLYGPLLFGVALVLLYIYEIEFEPFLTTQDRT